MSFSNSLKTWRNDRVLAHVVPLAIILIFGMFPLILDGISYFRDHSDLVWWRRKPEYLLLLVEALLATGAIIFFWKHYEFKWSKWVWFGVAMGAVGIAFWILPTQLYEWLDLEEDPESGLLKWMGVSEREKGFDGAPFEMNSPVWWFWVVTRFWRAVVVVAIAEEIFWRSFLMRFLLDRDGPEGRYWKVPFGKASWFTYAVVTVLFMLAHNPIDYFGAFIYGSLTYLVTVWTKNLLSVVVMHAVANLLMGLYALQFGKFGLW